MLHELLLALNGNVGGLFVESDGVIKVLPVSFLHPGEECLINKICEHGTYYRQFCSTIKRFSNFKENADVIPGMYLNALCYAVQNSILTSYESTLVELEHEIMMDSDTTLTHIQNKLQEYTLLFPSLAQLFMDIEKKKARGCQLLDIVNKYANSGIQTVQTAMRTILFHLHQIMFKQISAWLLHGLLMDPYGEFYIHKMKKIKPTPASNDPTNQDEELGIGGLSGEQLRQIQNPPDSISSTEQGSFEQFSLRADMLPSHIPTRVLLKLVFIGESVDMFENNSLLDTKKSILRHRAADFSKDLYHLSQCPTFQVLEFEKVVDSIRSCVTERLWEYVVQEADLKGVLFRIKCMFLLGRGDLFQNLLESADTLLRCPPTNMTSHDLNRILQQTLRGLNMNDESYQEFRLLVEQPPKGSAESSKKQNSWNLLSLDYKAKWPLHVFFTSLTLDRYNSIFRFLLSVKRAYVSLHKAWKQLMSRWSVSEASDDQGSLHQLRNHMQFLIDNLLTYLQVDVIESQFKELLDKIDDTKDFEVIQSTHETFLASLLSQCFLLNVPVHHCLTCILDGCMSFCSLIESCGESMTADQIEHVHSLQVMFQKQTLLLFKILTNSKTHQRNPCLVQLLLRIDFNKYFSSAGQQFG